MSKKKFIVGILALVLVFGFAVIGCDNGTTDNNNGPTDNDNEATYLYAYVTVSSNGGSSYSPIPNNTDSDYGPTTDANSYLAEGIDGNAHTKDFWFSALRAAYQELHPGTVLTESGESIIVSGFLNTSYRVKYTLTN